MAGTYLLEMIILFLNKFKTASNIFFTEQTLSPARCCRGERFNPPIGKNGRYIGNSYKRGTQKRHNFVLNKNDLSILKKAL